MKAVNCPLNRGNSTARLESSFVVPLEAHSANSLRRLRANFSSRSGFQGVDRRRLAFSEHAFMEVLDGERHADMLANMRTAWNDFLLTPELCDPHWFNACNVALHGLCRVPEIDRPLGVQPKLRRVAE